MNTPIEAYLYFYQYLLMFLLFVIAGIGWTLVIQLAKENTDLLKRLGRYTPTPPLKDKIHIFKMGIINQSALLYLQIKKYMDIKKAYAFNRRMLRFVIFGER